MQGDAADHLARRTAGMSARPGVGTIDGPLIGGHLSYLCPPKMRSAPTTATSAAMTIAAMKSALLAARHQPQPDEPDADAVEAVDQHPRQEQHVEGQERWAQGDVDERVPGVGPLDQHRQDHEVQVEVQDEARARVSRFSRKARPPSRRPRGSNQPTMPRRARGRLPGARLDGRGGHQRVPPKEKRRRARARPPPPGGAA